MRIPPRLAVAALALTALPASYAAGHQAAPGQRAVSDARAAWLAEQVSILDGTRLVDAPALVARVGVYLDSGATVALYHGPHQALCLLAREPDGARFVLSNRWQGEPPGDSRACPAGLTSWGTLHGRGWLRPATASR